jgi:hypothetical protein
MALGSTQTITEMSTRNMPLGVNAAGAYGDTGISITLLPGTDTLRYQGGHHLDYSVFRNLQQLPGSKQCTPTALQNAGRC